MGKRVGVIARERSDRSNPVAVEVGKRIASEAPPPRNDSYSTTASSARSALSALAQILLHKPRTQVYVHLKQGLLADALEAVDFSRLDDQDVSRAGLEFLPVHDVTSPVLSQELDFVVGMAVGTRSAAWQRSEKKHRDVDAALIGADELVRAALKRQILLTNAIHR